MTVTQLKQLLLENGPCCKWCGLIFETKIGQRRKGRPTLDKIRPRGKYEPGNVQILCHRCNGRKSDFEPADAKRMLASTRDPLHIDLTQASDWALWL